MANNNKLKNLSKSILKDAKNLQKLPLLIKLFKQNASTATNGILWLDRIFIHYNDKISFLTGVDNTENKAAQWIHKQYASFTTILLHLFESSHINQTIRDSFKTLLRFAELQNNETLFEQTLLILLFKKTLTNDLKSILTAFVFDVENSSNAIKSLTKICHLSPSQLLSKYFTVSKNRKNSTKTNDEPAKLQSIFSWNTLHILLMLSEASFAPQVPLQKKRKLNNNEKSPEEEIRNKKNYLSIAWLHYLGSKHLEIKIYHLILTKLESHIFEVFKRSNTNNGKFTGCHIRSNTNNVILLSDFLTDSYNVGGEISILSLKGLFTLIHQYNLDYPQFYDKLYQKLHSNIFFSKNASAFFKLLQMFLLKSDYIPSYLVAAFIKRLSRMSLFAPPHAIVFIVNIIVDLLRKYPAVRFLVDKSKRGNEGLMEAMKVHKRQKMNCDEGDDDKEVMDEDEECDEEEMIGTDPFDFECMDPKLCRANESSLWELKSLINHFEYKTSGHCFQTVTHFKDDDYKRVLLNRCHMFQYHKLLNYYFQRNEWFSRNANNEKRREEKYKKNVNKDEKKQPKQAYNAHPISVHRSEHLFPADSLFGDVFSI